MTDQPSPRPLSPTLFADPDCSAQARPFRVGDKWTGMVLRCLEDGHPRRFTELRVPLHWITPKVLTETLRSMERNGFINRIVHDENPPRVEYALTPLGRSLLGPLDTACAWARAHLRSSRRGRPTRPEPPEHGPEIPSSGPDRPSWTGFRWTPTSSSSPLDLRERPGVVDAHVQAWAEATPAQDRCTSAS